MAMPLLKIVVGFPIVYHTMAGARHIVRNTGGSTEKQHCEGRNNEGLA